MAKGKTIVKDLKENALLEISLPLEKENFKKEREKKLSFEKQRGFVLEIITSTNKRQSSKLEINGV